MDESAFLAAIVADPEEDGPRLVYADWLLERGDERGELIQLSCRAREDVDGGVALATSRSRGATGFASAEWCSPLLPIDVDPAASLNNTGKASATQPS